MSTEILRPDGNGNYTALTGTYASWDDVSPDEDSTYVYLPDGVNATRKDSSTLGSSGLSDETISEVRVYFRVKSHNATYQATFRPLVRLSGTDVNGSAVNQTTSYSTKNQALARPGGGDWAVSDLANLEVGLAITEGTLGGKYPAYYGGRCTQIYVQITYSSASPQTLTPSTIASAESIPSPSLVFPQELTPSTIASAESIPSPSLVLFQELTPSTIASAESIPSPSLVKLLQELTPSTIASAESIPSPTLVLSQEITPSTIASAESIPSPTLIKLLQEITSSTIASAETIPTPALVKLLQVLNPSTIASAEAFGTPAINPEGILLPVSISSAEAIGTPTVVRFAYHVIIDSRFIQVSPAINRVYVIGKDQYGNPVFGSDSEATEISLVGERLDFHLDTSIPTDDEAADVAGAMLDKRRLTARSGFIVVPPNVGQELWDVVWVTDTPTAQSSQLYRVTGIRLEFIRKSTKTRLTHKLILGAR